MRRISCQIFNSEDCAVFYLETDTQPEDVEDYEMRLCEMQLFVMPVTTKLLTKANRAMDVEVPFAFENHIPVLPLMQESGLDDVFNAKFGDLQYLDKHNTDPTAIPFEEKLTKYLESVIVGDELAKKVRAAFDAYIFLSYRKKDRKYAQELMKLIHSNPLCRDIAIWYDEFLTPGENFNEAIRAALEKSELFALAVTPNLINEINYILTTEYPMACGMGKKILPAEMESTDRSKLHELYADLPELIANGDTAALAARLSVLLETIAVQENDADPQHNFFIGLAYLGGIDVEVNHERAVALITGSAEQGYIPALEKLVAMYNNGEGVRRDYHKAVAWQEKLVEQYKMKYEENPDKYNASSVIFALQNLGNDYYALGRILLAQKAYTEMSSFSESFANKYKELYFVRCQSVSYGKLGDIARVEGDLAKAKMYYELSYEIANKNNDETVKAKRDLSISCTRLGDIEKDEGNLHKAREYYEKSLTIDKKLAEDLATIETRRDLSTSYNRLGDITKAEDDLDAAYEYYMLGTEIRYALLKETGLSSAARDLAVNYGLLGIVAENKGDPNKAELLLKQAVVLFQTIEKKTGTILAKRDLSVGYIRLGNVAQDTGDIPKAKAYYEQGLIITKAIAKETGTIQSYDDLAYGYSMLGFLLKSRAVFEKALNIWTQLAEKIPDNPSFRRRADMVSRAIQAFFN